jgi:hypothetical protein
MLARSEIRKWIKWINIINFTIKWIRLLNIRINSNWNIPQIQSWFWRNRRWNKYYLKLNNIITIRIRITIIIIIINYLIKIRFIKIIRINWRK